MLPTYAVGYSYVTSGDVKDYTYCPTIVWIKSALGVREPPSVDMVLGSSKPYRSEVFERIGIPKPWAFEVLLRCKHLGISGVVDLVGGSRRYEVAEVKAFKRRNYSHFTSQLMFYAYLTSVVLGPVVRAHLVLGDRVKTYSITDRVLQEVERVVKRVREIKNSDRPPTTPYAGSKRCVLCWYRRYCPSV
ncbi:MAG: CRISPR-associated protein Cas4 [Sulfolobales archaeon]